MTWWNRKSISAAIIVLVVVLIGGFNIAFYDLYRRSLETLENSLGERLLSIGHAVSPEIENVAGDEIPGGELRLMTLLRLQEYLENIRAADNLSGIYLLGDNNKNLLSWGDSLSKNQLLLPLHAEGIARAQLGDANVSLLYRVDKRYFKSAYYPLGRDSVTAVLIIESSFGFFEELSRFKKHVLYVNISALAALLLIGGVILFLNRQLLKVEKLLISQAALSQMGQMAAIIAHEVRNPLAIIKATAERLRRKFGAVDPRESEFFDYIPQEVDRLHQITSQYLQFASPATAVGERESIAVVARSLHAGIEKEFERKQIRCTLQIDPAAGGQKVDSLPLRQILINLLRNALEATASGGLVTVEVRRNQLKRHLEIEVKDSGEGMSQGDLRQIFDPFYSTKTRGTGLGLFVVKRLVENLSGRIAVESHRGEGTRFVIYLPLSDDGEDYRS